VLAYAVHLPRRSSYPDSLAIVKPIGSKVELPLPPRIDAPQSPLLRAPTAPHHPPHQYPPARPLPQTTPEHHQHRRHRTPNHQPRPGKQSKLTSIDQIPILLRQRLLGLFLGAPSLGHDETDVVVGKVGRASGRSGGLGLFLLSAGVEVMRRIFERRGKRAV
jgi:hypothetical protein